MPPYYYYYPIILVLLVPIILSSTLHIFPWISQSTTTTTNPRKLNNNQNPPIKHFSYTILSTIQHPANLFTQGFTFRTSDGALLEGTGLEGQSALYVWEMDKKTNDPVRIDPTKTFRLPHQHFGEGIVEYRGLIYQLTWRNGKVYVSDPNSLQLKTTLNMPPQLAEGWGACISPGHDALIFSDGSARIFWYSTMTTSTNDIITGLALIRSVEIRDCSSSGGKGQLIGGLNELEMVPLRVTHPEEATGGFSSPTGALLWANIFGSSCIVVADPLTGLVRAYIHLDGLNPSANPYQNVYNGIAFRNLDETIWVTGKQWDLIYKIKLIEIPQAEVSSKQFKSCVTTWNPPNGVIPKSPYSKTFTCPSV
jgi:glutamine cyclotransferase